MFETEKSLYSLHQKLTVIQDIEADKYQKEEAINILKCFATDENEEVRWTTAQTLVLFDGEKVEEILLNMLKDKEEIVRINACDSLSICKSKKTIFYLKEAITKDKSSLVRGYSALSIAYIALIINYNKNELISFFKKIIFKERVYGAKLRYYTALFVLGEKGYLKDLTDGINNRLYRNRCAVANLLGDLYSDGVLSNEEFVKVEKVLKSRLQVENSVAVKSSIEEVLKLFANRKL